MSDYHNLDCNAALDNELAARCRREAAENELQASRLRLQAAREALRPSTLQKPLVFRDGNAWCAMQGSPDETNLMEAVVAFGDTPEAAMSAFDDAWGGGECGPPLYCIRTGAALATVDGEPVVEPRPSPEYVRLLEEFIMWDPMEFRHWDGRLPVACINEECDHDTWPVGCLRALAAELQETKDV